MADITLKERCQRRLASLKSSRQGFEDDAKEIASFAQPARSRWLATDANKGRMRNRRLNNSHGIFSFRTLQNGMASGLTSPSRPWMTLGSYSEQTMENPEVKQYWAEIERLMYAFFAQTNFYQATKTGYLEMGLFGTEACIALAHPTEGMVCHQLTFGEYWLGMGDAMTPDTLYRECPITVRNAVEMFGMANLDPKIGRMYDESRGLDDVLTFYHAIEPNTDHRPGMIGFQGKPWRSVYWHDDDSNKDRIIQREGFEEQPFWASRWDTTGGDVWGQGPGHDALPDLRELQVQVKRKAEATDWHIKPEQVASARVKLKRMPGNVVSVAGDILDISKLVSVPYQVGYEAIAAIKDDIENNKQAIDRATYAELFMAISMMQGSNYKNIEEISARNEEKLTQLGPVIDRVNNEKLEPAIERTFGLMQRAGIVPPAPDVLRDHPDIKIDFVSTLTQMQRMVGLGQIERGVGFVGNLAGLFPGVLNKIDANELVDEYWSRSGAPPKALRSNEDADAMSEEQEHSQQAAQTAEMAGKAAPAAGVAVDAARLMSETPEAAPPAVADLVPLLPR